MPPLIICQHKCRDANDVNHVAFSTVCGFSETSEAIYLIKLSGALATSGVVWDILFFDPYHPASHDVRRRATELL
jgi:hypothetical protein